MGLYKANEAVFGIPLPDAYLRITSYEVQPTRPDNTYDVNLFVNYYPSKTNPDSYQQINYMVNVPSEENIYLDQFYDLLLGIIPDTTKDAEAEQNNLQ